MTNLTLFPISRMRWLLLPALLALFALASLFTAVAQAEDCLYEVHDACLETSSGSVTTVLKRYFVIEHANNRQRSYDVWIKADRPDVFDQVLQPIRSQSPDLQQYNNQFSIRASGEIGTRDLQKAVNRGLVEEVSRTLIDDRPIVSVSYSPNSPASLPAPPPWRVEEIAPTDVLTTYVVATPVLTTYVHLQRSEPGIVPLNPSLAEQALVPDGMLATFFMADETTMQALIVFLNLD